MQPESEKTRRDDFVRTAAFLKREYEGRNYDEDGGKQIIYVFDSDVIKTKCAPWQTGPAGRGRGYGIIFSKEMRSSTDDGSVGASGTRSDVREKPVEVHDKKAEQIASILANHVLRLGSTPIFQLPSHATETNNVYRAVRRSVEVFDEIGPRQTSSRRSFELARAIALVRYQASLGTRSEDLSEAIEHVLRWLTHREDTKQARLLREWDAYYGLEAEFGGIYSLADAGVFFSEEREMSAAFSVLSEAGRSTREDKIFRSLKAHWAGMFEDRARHNIEADAEALANLFLVNSRLAETKYKCIFVTGDRALARAAYEGIPRHLLAADENSTLSSSEGASPARDFSLRFVRHLWAYSSDALIDAEGHRFGDLFGGLLAAWSEFLGFSMKRLEDLSDGKGPRYTAPEDRVASTLAKWEELTEKSITRLSMEEYRHHDVVRQAIWNAVNRSVTTGDWDDIQARLLAEVDRIRDRTILSMSDLGIDFIIQAGKLGKRNPPELVFDTLHNANNIFVRLSSTGTYRDAKSFEADFAKLKDDCYESSQDGDDRQESHLKFLVLGAVFASAERWLIALSYAKKAIAIIRRPGGKIPVREGYNSNMSGREAYFLAAVAQRMIAAVDRDFVRALDYLDHARAALEADHRQETAHSITFARFDSERLAMALGRYYLARSKTDAHWQDELVVGINSSASVMIAPFLDWIRASNLNTLRKVTVVNLSINLIQTFVISEFRRINGLEQGTKSPVYIETIAKAVDAVKRLTNFSSDDSRKINATNLIKTYAIVGEMFLGETPTAIKRHADQLHQVLKNLDDVIVTRYDEWRYLALIDFVERRFDVNLGLGAAFAHRIAELQKRRSFRA